MNFIIEDHTILLTLTGSRAYGTYTENSDWDLKGIAVAPLNTYLGATKNFEQFEGKFKQTPSILGAVRENYESVVYDIRKFCNLAIQNNPNILEIIFLPENYWITKSHWYSNHLIHNKDMFLSKKCRYSYAGFAHAQLKRIRSHREWLLAPPTHQPSRKEFGLSEQQSMDHNQLKAATSLIDKQIEQWMLHPEEEIPITVLCRARESIIDLVSNLFVLKNQQEVNDELVRAAAKKYSFDTNFSEVIVRERSYKAALNRWNQYLTWKEERNQVRSALEAKYGFDCKHASHLVRLLRTCKELLTTGKLIVNRPDAEELLAIRNGAWTYEKVEEYAESMDKEMDVLYKTSVLPYSPNIDKINQLCELTIREFHNL